jgi:hypothetical protein
VAEFIVLRVVPAAPIDPTTFANYLNGLTIDVFDASFAAPRAGMPGDPTPPIGSAAFNAPTFVAFPVPLIGPPPLASYPSGTTIVQHFAPVISGLQVTGVDMQAVATAVIPYTAPAAEYPGVNPRPDLRIQFQRTGSQTIADPGLHEATLVTFYRIFGDARPSEEVIRLLQ